MVVEILAYVAFGGSVLALACSLLVAFRGAPAQVIRQAESLFVEVRKLQAELSNSDLAVRGLVDEARQEFDRAESKRKSAAATLSKLEKAQGGNTAGGTGGDLLHMDRATMIAELRRRHQGG
jgi:hypothetical protein